MPSRARAARHASHARAVGPRAVEHRRRREHQQRPAGRRLRLGVARVVAARVRGILRSRGDRGADTGTPVSGRRRHLPVDAQGIWRRARLSFGLVLLDQQLVSMCRCCWSTWPASSRSPVARPGLPGSSNQKTVRARCVDRLAGARCGARTSADWRSASGFRTSAGWLRSRASRWCSRRPPPRGRAAPASHAPANTGSELGHGRQLRRHVQRHGRHRARLDDGRRDSRSGARSGAGDLHCRRRLDCRRICSSPARS